MRRDACCKQVGCTVSKGGEDLENHNSSTAASRTAQTASVRLTRGSSPDTWQTDWPMRHADAFIHHSWGQNSGPRRSQRDLDRRRRTSERNSGASWEAAHPGQGSDEKADCPFEVHVPGRVPGCSRLCAARSPVTFRLLQGSAGWPVELRLPFASLSLTSQQHIADVQYQCCAKWSISSSPASAGSPAGGRVGCGFLSRALLRSAMLDL